jgi:His/Glu/Gln/Arg/opine family amino acid ABC transporter permease subunit
LRIFAICLVLGLSLGLLVGLGRYSRNRWIHIPATIFVEFFRNTPVLVQILWFYFALPILLPFQISPLAAASLGISLNSAAFSAEIYRGGIQSIETGQWDGARALGMTLGPGDAPHHSAAGAEAHAAGPDQPRDRDLQDVDARLGRRLCRAAAAGQADRLAELQSDRGLYRRRGASSSSSCGRWCSSATSSNVVLRRDE